MPRVKKVEEIPESESKPEKTKEKLYHTIHIPRLDKGTRVVSVGVNAKTYSLQTGVDIHNVPDEVVSVLRNAVETVYRDVERQDKTGIDKVPEKQHAYPFSIIDTYTEPRPRAEEE